MKALNIKTRKRYDIINETVVNATNEKDGQEMVLYEDINGSLFVCEKSEFYSKFYKITKQPCNNCQGCGCTVCNGFGYTEQLEKFN